MIGIPLSSVVAFLRPRGALGVLEGAPVIRHDREAGWIHPVGIRNFERAGLHDHDAMLYLGDGEICPAAEGWAARVLALAQGAYLPDLTLLSVSARFVRLERDGVLHEWRWDTEGESARLTSMVGAPPATPAERLAAVLRYEMERAK